MRKLEALKVGKRRKKEKLRFVSWKACFSSCCLFVAPFHLHFKDDF